MTDDDSNTIELNRRRVLGGIVAIGGAAAAAGAGTTAYFSDTQSSSGNTVSAGSLELSVPSSGSIAISNLYPGEASTENSTSADYTGGVEAALDWGINITDDPNPQNGQGDLSTLIDLTTADLVVVDTNGNETVTDYSGQTLSSLQSSGPFGDVGRLQDGYTARLDIVAELNTNAGNPYQGESVSFDVGFKARQVDPDNGPQGTVLQQGNI